LTDITPNLSLPYLMPAQAQKHVTVNESIRMLDALIQMNILDRDLTSPPGNPADGDRYIVAASATGSWAAKANQIAAYQDGAWMFYAPREGFTVWVADEDKLVAFNGTAWVVAGGGSINSTPLIGVNATADTTNRLSVASAATLLNHEGAGHQVKINKANAADTASLLFQTGFSGRAEIGTTGNDRLSFKLSADGVTWRTAMIMDATGSVLVSANSSSVPAPPTQTVLHVAGADGLQPRFVFDCFHNSGNAPGNIVFRSANGTAASPSAHQAGVRIGQFSAFSYGTTGYSAAATAHVAFESTETHTDLAKGTQILFSTAANGTGGATPRMRIANSGNTEPFTDNAFSLGSSSFRWSSIWAANGTIQTSDARDKIEAGQLTPAAAIAIVDAVQPRLFKWRVGGREVNVIGVDDLGEAITQIVEKPGQRIHAGFFAQDVGCAMHAVGLDCGAWGLDDQTDPDSRQWLRPDQLIAVLWAAVRQTRAEMAELRRSNQAEF